MLARRDSRRSRSSCTQRSVHSWGRRDRIIPWQDAERLAREVAGPVELLVIEDGNHVANSRPYRYRPQSADWMAERLGATGP